MHLPPPKQKTDATVVDQLARLILFDIFKCSALLYEDFELSEALQAHVRSRITSDFRVSGSSFILRSSRLYTAVLATPAARLQLFIQDCMICERQLDLNQRARSCSSAHARATMCLWLMCWRTRLDIGRCQRHRRVRVSIHLHFGLCAWPGPRRHASVASQRPDADLQYPFESFIGHRAPCTLARRGAGGRWRGSGSSGTPTAGRRERGDAVSNT